MLKQFKKSAGTIDFWHNLEKRFLQTGCLFLNVQK